MSGGGPTMRRELLFLLLLLTLKTSVLLSQGNITAQISPSSISVKPGEKIGLNLMVRNLGNADVNITGVRVHVISKTLFGIPVSIYLGEYPIPFEKPVKVRAGGETTIEKVVEVPNIPVAGDFSVELVVQTTGGSTTANMSVSLSYSLLSLIALLAAIFLISGVLYLIFRHIRMGRRPESKIEHLISERDRYSGFLRKLEEKKARGEGGIEHEKLREEYSSKIAEIQSKLDEAAKKLQADVEKLLKEINSLEDGIKIIKARAELGEISKRDARREIEKRERLLVKKREDLSRKNSLLARIKGI